MSMQLCLARLALLSLAAVSDPACEELIKPLDDKNTVFGKWIYYAGASDSKPLMELIKYATSSWTEILPINGSDEYAFRSGDRIDGECHYGAGNGTVTGKQLKLCPDCYIWLEDFDLGDGKKAQNIFLYTKTGHVDDSYLEDFKKQLKCLNIPEEIYFPETTNLCPDEQKAT